MCKGGYQLIHSCITSSVNVINICKGQLRVQVVCQSIYLVPDISLPMVPSEEPPYPNTPPQSVPIACMYYFNLSYNWPSSPNLLNFTHILSSLSPKYLFSIPSTTPHYIPFAQGPMQHLSLFSPSHFVQLQAPLNTTRTLDCCALIWCRGDMILVQ